MPVFAHAQEVPAAPVQFTATQIEQSAQVLLQWSAPSAGGTGRYRIYRSDTETISPTADVLLAQRASTQFIDVSVQHGLTYYYAIATLDGEVISVLTPVQAITITSLRAEDTKQGGEVLITWDATSDPVDVYRSDDPEKIGRRIGTRITTSQLLDDDAETGITQYYRLRFRRSTGTSDPTEAVAVIPTDTIPPPPPRNARARITDDGEVRLSWSSPTGESEVTYAVFRSTSSGNDGEERTQTDKRSYTETGLRDKEIYYYRVQALDAGGNRSRFTDYIKVTVVNETNLDSRVAELQAVATGRSGQITLTWRNPSRDSFSYNEVYRSTQQGVRGTLIKSKLRSTTLSDTKLTNNVRYYYTIESYTRDDISLGTSIQVSVVPFDEKATQKNTPTGPPWVTRVRTQDEGDGLHITLRWNNPPLHEYHSISIYRSTALGDIGERIVSNIRTSTYTDSAGIISDTEYYYIIRTVDSTGAESNNTQQVRGLATVALAGEGADTDSDGDGLSDAYERAFALHPRIPNDTSIDEDQDGLTLAQEAQYGTNPWSDDTDEDGYPDATEIANGYDPDGDGRKQQVQQTRNNLASGNYAYSKQRLGSLQEEQTLASELRVQLEDVFGRNRIPNPRSHWPTLVNAYIYGGYTADEIANTLRFGPGLVHPTLPAEVWRTTAEYQRKR